MYTPSVVSKSLPKVSIVMVPGEGAVQFHHTEAGPERPAGSGSPGSAVAPRLVPNTLAGYTDISGNTQSDTPGKLSFAGGVGLIVTLATGPRTSVPPMSA